MKHTTVVDQHLRDTEDIDLPWPKTWRGAYLCVIGSFILWLVLLVALTEFFI